MSQYEVYYKYSIDHKSYTKAMDLMNKKLGKFLGRLREYKKASQQMQKVLAKTETSQKRITQSTKGLSTAVDLVTKRSDRYNRIQSQLTNSLGRQNAKLAVQKLRVSELSDRLRHFSTNIASLRTMMIGFYAVQGVKAIVRSGMDFSKQMIRIKANTQATTDQMAALKKAAFDLNIGSIFSPAEIAEGMFILTKAGESVATVLNMMPDIIDFSTVAEVAPKEGADILHSIMKQYNLDMTEAKYTTDVLAYAQTKSKLSADQMFESLKRVGGVAFALGVSFEETVAHLAAIKESGIGASKAGTVLMNMYQRMAAASDKGKEAAKELGITLSDYMVNGRLEAVKLLKAIKAAGATQPQLKAMFEMRGQRAALPMMKWLEGADIARDELKGVQNSFESFLAGMKDVEGYGSRMAKEYLTGLYGALTVLGSAFQNLKVRMSETMSWAIVPFSKMVTWLIEKLTQTDGAAGVFNKILLTIVGSLMLLTAVGFMILIPLGLIAAALSSLVLMTKSWGWAINTTGKLLVVFNKKWRLKLYQRVRVNFRLMKRSLWRLSAAFWKGAVATGAWAKKQVLALFGIKAQTAAVTAQTGAVHANNAAWYANPLVWVVAGIAAVVFWFKQAYDATGSLTGALKKMGADILWWVVKPLEMVMIAVESFVGLLNMIPGINLPTNLGSEKLGAYTDTLANVGSSDMSKKEEMQDMTASKTPVVNVENKQPINVSVENTYNEDTGIISTEIAEKLGYTSS